MVLPVIPDIWYEYESPIHSCMLYNRAICRSSIGNVGSKKTSSCRNKEGYPQADYVNAQLAYVCVGLGRAASCMISRDHGSQAHHGDDLIP